MPTTPRPHLPGAAAYDQAAPQCARLGVRYA